MDGWIASHRQIAIVESVSQWLIQLPAWDQSRIVIKPKRSQRNIVRIVFADEDDADHDDRASSNRRRRRRRRCAGAENMIQQVLWVLTHSLTYLVVIVVRWWCTYRVTGNVIGFPREDDTYLMLFLRRRPSPCRSIDNDP